MKTKTNFATESPRPRGGRNFFRALLLLFFTLGLCGQSFAANYFKWTLVVTNVPVVKAALSADGDLRQVTNNTPANAGLFWQSTNTMQSATTNLWAFLQLYGFTNINAIKAGTNDTWLPTNTIVLESGPDHWITFTTLSNWCTITPSTNTVTQSPITVRVPVINEPSLIVQTQVIAGLVDAISSTKATNKVPADALAFDNFLGADVVAASYTNKSFSGGTHWLPTILGGSFNGTISGICFTNGTLWLTSAPPNKIFLMVTTNTIFTNIDGRAYIFPDASTDVFAGGPEKVIASIGDIISSYPVGNTPQILVDDGTVSIVENSYQTNVQFFGPTNTVLGAMNLASANINAGGTTNTDITATNILVGTIRATVIGHFKGLDATNNAFSNSTSVQFTSQANALRDTSLAGTNTLTGDLATPMLSITSLAAGNNIAVDLKTNYLISFDGSINGAVLCGLVAKRDGYRCKIYNNLGNPLTITTNTSDPTPANRFSLVSAVDVVVQNHGFVELSYWGSDALWHIENVYPSTNVLVTNAVSTVKSNNVNVGTGFTTLETTNSGNVTFTAEAVGATVKLSASVSLSVTSVLALVTSTTFLTNWANAVSNLVAAKVSKLADTATNLSVASFTGTTNWPIVWRDGSGNPLGGLDTNGHYAVAANITYDSGANTLMLRTQYVSVIQTTNIYVREGGAVYGQQNYATYQQGAFNGWTNFYALGFDYGGLGTWQATATVMTNGNYRFWPFYSGSGGLISSLSVTVATAVASAKFRIGIYESSSTTNLYPGALLVDAGEQSGASAAVVTVTGLSATLKPGRLYWVATQSDSAIALGGPNAITGMRGTMGANNLAAELSSSAHMSMIELTGTYGAMPANFPTAGTMIPFYGFAKFTGVIARFQ